MPKRVPPLSAKALAAIRPSTKVIELSDGYVPGLRVRIQPNGTSTWSLNIRDRRGVRRRFDVGSGLGLAEARRKAEELRRAIRDGADPTAERRAARGRERAARDGSGTLGALLDVYFDHGPGSQQRRACESKQLVRAVFAKLLSKPLLDIERAELQLIADGWRSPATASLTVRLLRPCLKWAAKRGLARDGAHDIEQPTTIGKRERVVAREELRAILPHLDKLSAHGDVVRWLLWTGCRLNEAAGMTWAEIDGRLSASPPPGRKTRERARWRCQTASYRRTSENAVQGGRTAW